MGYDKLVKTRKKNLRLFEDEKQGDISFAEINKKRNEIMNRIMSAETSKQTMSVNRIKKKKKNVAKSYQIPANVALSGEYLYFDCLRRESNFLASTVRSVPCACAFA